MFPGVTPHAIEICPFYGVENEEEADGWIRRYELWATQEKLNHKQKLQLVLLALFDAAYIWARDLDLEKVKWVAFRHLFRERYVGDPTPWPGSAKFPFWLYFSGTARLAAGQSQGCAGVGIVLVSPLKVIGKWAVCHSSVQDLRYRVDGIQATLAHGTKEADNAGSRPTGGSQTTEMLGMGL
ncbi:unnamed protein product [Sphagnum balticum]